MSGGGPAYAPPDHAVLVLGPPRSGKTTSIVVPNVLAASGAVLSTSTKCDVLELTAGARRRVSRCLLFDPSGTVTAPPGVQLAGWSPLASSKDPDAALLVAAAMTGAARPGGDRGESAHWTERARALLGVLFHAAALGDEPMSFVVSAVNRHQPGHAVEILDAHGSGAALDVLSGIVATDSREQSGIWSTAASVLSAYQLRTAVAGAALPAIDPEQSILEGDTIYVVAPAEHQRHAAPLVAGLVHDLRRAAYRLGRSRATGASARRLVLVLDELANIAPLHDLPQLVAEGAGQGVLTLGCLQDLSQARARWHEEGEGLFSLFGTKVLLPGITDRRTLELVSLLAGQREEAQRSLSSQTGRQTAFSLTWQPRPALAPEAVAAAEPGTAVVVVGAVPGQVGLTPWFASPLWRQSVVEEALLSKDGRSRTPQPAAPSLPSSPARPRSSGRAAFGRERSR